MFYEVHRTTVGVLGETCKEVIPAGTCPAVALTQLAEMLSPYDRDWLDRPYGDEEQCYELRRVGETITYMIVEVDYVN